MRECLQLHSQGRHELLWEAAFVSYLAFW
jgi:hypothetical protein